MLHAGKGGSELGLCSSTPLHASPWVCSGLMPQPEKSHGRPTVTTSHYAHSARLAEICLGKPKMVMEGTSGTVEAERRGKGVSVSVGACFCLLPFRNRKASVQTVRCQTDAEDRALLLEQSHLLHHSLLPSLSSQTQLPQTAGNSVIGSTRDKTHL